MPELDRLPQKAVALAWHQRPSVDPFRVRAAATSPCGTFVNKPRAHQPTSVTLNRIGLDAV
jgi:hypothetical protein